MRIMVTGSRGWNHPGPIEKEIADAIYGLPEDEENVLVHGGASGADYLAEVVAKKMGLSVETFHANWDVHGKAAGPIRNAEMVASEPDLVLAFWDGKSKGTKGAINLAYKSDLPVIIIKRTPLGFEREIVS